MRHTAVTSILALSLSAGAALAEGEVNLYSSRHYDTDERLYSDFEAQTGITINRIEGNADELIARMESEGANSPADVLLTVDTSRLTRAKEAGVLQAIDSELLEARVPAYLQDDDNQWFGFSQRSRIIFYDKNDVENPPATYADLAKPEYEGLVCIRSSTNTYNQTLLASIVTPEGAEAAKAWAAAASSRVSSGSAGKRERPSSGVSNCLKIGRASRSWCRNSSPTTMSPTLSPGARAPATPLKSRASTSNSVIRWVTVAEAATLPQREKTATTSRPPRWPR